MAAIGWEFDSVYNFNENTSAYTNNTLEAQSPAGTSFTLFNSTADYLLLGHSQKFDMAIFDVDTAGSLGALTWQYSTGSSWVTFVPASGRFATDPDDDEGAQYDFSSDGAEIFPANLLSDWAKREFTIDGVAVSKYWIRINAASTASAPTIKRIQCRPIAIYTTSKNVFELLQLKNVTGTTDFDDTTIPTKETVDFYINEAQAYIDMNTRKSWRPNYVVEAYLEFNLNGFKLEYPNPQKIIDLKIWNGANWDSKTQGRTKDYFFVSTTGMIQFARYFLLPARFTSYNAPVWRWGGGEFTMPIKVTYLAGRDINTDALQGGIVQEIAKKMAAINVVANSDFGNLAVSGMDRVSMSEKVNTWQQEIEDRIDFLTAFEVF